MTTCTKLTDRHVEVETITPAMARVWLDHHNTRNRKIRGKRVALIASEIRSGRWTLTPDCIAFDAYGTLINGQHRLAAIVEADLPVCAIVAYGLPAQSFDVTDDVMKRSFADVLHLREVENNTTIAAITFITLCWETFGEIQQSLTVRDGRAPSKNELLERYEADPDGFSAAVKAGRRIHDALPGVSVSWWCALWYRFACIDAVDASGFEHMVRTGADLDMQPLPMKHPARILRETVLRDAALARRTLRDGPGRRMFMAVATKAWNAYRNGEEISLLRFAPGGARPEKFPTPI